MWRKGNPNTLLVEIKLTAFMIVEEGEHRESLKLNLPCDPEISFLEHTSENETCNSTRYMHPSVHNSTKIWKDCKCPSTETQEWLKKIWYIYKMGYYSATKKNKILPLQQHG